MARTFGECGEITVETLGGGTPIFMPKFICEQTLVSAMTNAQTEATSGEASFYTSIEADHSELGYDTATLQPTADSLEQTLVDTGTGNAGVLTQVLSPRLGGAGVGTVTIRVTIDGTESVFVNNHSASNEVTILGDVMPWLAQSSTSINAGYGSGMNIGYTTASTGNAVSILSPFDSLTRGLPIGMVFTDSLKVTVQGSVNLTAGSATHKAVAAWLNYIPEGL